jgi:predicted DsbA family dithiol-disulfide isomerase
MKVDIWSDIRCPFCYIGKRKLETALQSFDHKDDVEVIWHSFELEPDLVSDPKESIYDHLAKRKRISKDQSLQMHTQMAEYAKAEGLTFNFDSIVVANSFDGHRLIHLATAHGLGGIAKERLFKAYYTEGADISNKEALKGLGTEIGLDPAAVTEMLESDAYAADVREDEQHAHDIGVTGVPFFVINQRYAVSGAQPADTFLKALNHAWTEQETEATAAPAQDGASCDIDGNC